MKSKISMISVVNIDGVDYVKADDFYLLIKQLSTDTECSELESDEFEDDEAFGHVTPLKELVRSLQDQHQQDCIEINRLNTTIDVLAKKYSGLREIMGMD